MKVKFKVIARVSWMGELEMTQEQYDEYCERIDNVKSFRREYIAMDMLEKAKRLANEPDEWDDQEVDTFEVVEE